MAGLPPVHDAARRGDLARVQELVSLDPSAVRSVTGYGGTALIDAAARGHVHVVRYLVTKGADVNHRNLHGWTALYMACRNGQREVVALLLKEGADVGLTNSYGLTPLMRAAREGHPEVLRLLLEHGGSRLDARDSDGKTALWWACYWGHQQEARILLEAGADPTITDKAQRLPVDAAREEGHVRCVRLLEESNHPFYILSRARRLRDVEAALQQPPTDGQVATVPPPYLRTRVNAGGPAPSLQVQGGRRRDELEAEVLRYGVLDLKGELFVELLEGLGRWRA